MRRSVKMTMFMKLALIAFVVFCLLTILQLGMKSNDMRLKLAEIREQIERVKDGNEELGERLEEDFDDEYVEQIARDEMNYCKPDEIVIFNDR